MIVIEQDELQRKIEELYVVVAIDKILKELVLINSMWYKDDRI